MKKYNFDFYMNQLSKQDYDKALIELPRILDMTQKHFKYNILNGKIEDAPNIRIDQLQSTRDYLQEKLPGRKKIKLDDLVNEPSSQAEAA